MKIKLSKSQWEQVGRTAGWMGKTSATHREVRDSQGLSKDCHPQDLIIVNEGLQCSNCLAITRDHGITWEYPKDRRNYK